MIKIIFKTFIQNNYVAIKKISLVLLVLLSIVLMCFFSIQLFTYNNMISMFASEKSNKSYIENKSYTKITMVWDMDYNNKFDVTKVKNIEGLDVLSPTWFQISSESGDFINRASKQYVDWAHDSGYKVWALFSNDFKSPQMTNKFLNNTSSKEKLTKQLLEQYVKYNIDGINIDFEMINSKDTEKLVEFVKDLALAFKQKNIVVSIDISVPESSQFLLDKFKLESVLENVDYIVMMGYDQHWSGSRVAGSVSQISWVENNIKKLLDLNVPEEKIILGIPFYTRLWEETIYNKSETKVSGKTVLTMLTAKKNINENKFQSRWDEKSGQFIIEYKKNNSNYKIWLEDENSLDIRTSLTLKYNLAGVAAWCKGYETDTVWTIIKRNLKEFKTYEEWLEKKTEPILMMN